MTEFPFPDRKYGGDISPKNAVRGRPVAERKLFNDGGDIWKI